MPRPLVTRIVAVSLCVLAIAVVVGFVRAQRRAVAADLGRARDLHGVSFTGADDCRRCHPDHFTSWRRTFHRTMTQDVSPARAAAVAGDFSDVKYRYGRVVARMHRDPAGRFLMTFSSDGDTGPAVEAEVVRAVGSRRYQQYFADVGGALWRLPMAFHVEEKRWFHMNGAFLTPDPEPEPRAGATAEERGLPDAGNAVVGIAAQPRFGGGAFDRHVTRWNDNCVFCHNVGANPGQDPATGTFRTSVAELGIACEACHGPGEEHARTNEDPVRRYALHLSAAADPSIVNPSRLSPARAADLCGRCHGQRISDDVAPFLAHGDPFVPGDDLALYSAPLWRDTPLRGDRDAFAERFWGDGTPRLTAYEYQGLLQSRCAQRGSLTCTSCHGMHDGDPKGQIRPSATGDRMCTGCHAALAAPAAIARHTRHDPGGPGARCVSCHMPRIVYGVLDIHPSHRIEIPEPARAAVAGRPDACSLCHVDAGRAWAVAARARLWPAKDAAVTAGGAAATRTDDGSLRDLLFAGDPIGRAVAADALGLAPNPSARMKNVDDSKLSGSRADVLLEAMASERYPAVRHLAARALGRVMAAQGSTSAESVRDFDATAPVAERSRVLTRLRNELASQHRASTRGPLDVARIAALRAASRLVDIDIGE